MSVTPSPAVVPLSGATRKSILLLSLATFSSMVAQRICDPMLPELSRVFSVSVAEAAQVVSLFALVYGAAQLVYGPLGDRLGKFRVVTLATLACSLGSIVAAFAGSLNMLLLARVMVALGAAALIPLALAWTGDAVPYAQRQEALARVGLGTTLGLVGGQLVGGLMTDTLGWRWAFGFMTVLFGGVGLLLWSELQRQRAVAAHETPAAQPAPGTSPGPRPGYGAQALGIVAGRWQQVVLLVAFLEGIVGFGVVAIWATHLNQALGLTLSAAGAIVALYGLGGVGYMATARHLIPRLGERGLVLLGVGLVVVCALVLAFAPHWGWVVPSSLLAGFGFFMFHNTIQTHATQMAPQARGTGVSLFAASLFMGQSTGVWLATHLIAPLGTARVIALGGLLLGALGLFLAGMLRRRERQRGVQEP